MLKIESSHNDTFKTCLSLTTAKGLKAESLFLLSGEKLIREFLQKPNLKIAYEIVSGDMKPLVSQHDAKLLHFSGELFAEVDVLGTRSNILVLEQPTIAAMESFSGYVPRGVEVILPVGDPGNLGALIRSCEAFAVPRVILTKEAAHPFLPKSVKASAGSVLRLPLARGPALSECPANAIALDMQGVALRDFKWPANGLLVVGEEGQGLGAKFTQRISIPTQGVESLNAVVAASIALAHKARAV